MQSDLTTARVELSVQIWRYTVARMAMYSGVVILREDGGLGRMVSIRFHRRPSVKSPTGYMTIFGADRDRHFMQLHRTQPQASKKLMRLLNRYVAEATRRHNRRMMDSMKEEFSAEVLLGAALSGTDLCEGRATSHGWSLDMDDHETAQMCEIAFLARPNPSAGLLD